MTSIAIAVLTTISATPIAAQACGADMQQEVAAGWQSYRDNDMRAAAAAFTRAQRMCRTATAPVVGLAYVDLRNGDVDAARKRLDDVLEKEPANIDALVGRGTVAWREGETDLVRSLFTEVRRLDPDNAEAASFLARVPAVFAAPQRVPLQKPDTVVYPSRTNGDRFEVRNATGWTPFYIKGMNLGAALPGKHPSEFPDSATYALWIRQMSEMGINTIRAYTIHPPHFYSALATHNRQHSAMPMWLVHGVWTELPPKNNFDDTAWKNEFFREMRRVVDVAHGRADLPPRPGHASGHYTADVSEWWLATIIGREWEPYAIRGFNKLSKRTSWRGRYLDMPSGTASEAWMSEASESIVAYEMDRYNAQRPVAYTNWPTLDPLAHPSESTVKEELALRRARGEKSIVEPKEYDNDAVQLDAMAVRATAAFPAGWFASYHAYPYYPDFMIHDRPYADARSSEGRSNYFGYLAQLKRHHPKVPVIISEYGVPASIGIAHLQPQGLHHGGMTEQGMAESDARMTREIAEAGMAGGMLFAWIDEWFKKNWIVIDHEIPLERTRLWHNRMDAEQHYGVFAMDAKAAVPGATIHDRLTAWREVQPTYDDGARLRMAADESYLWILYEPASDRRPQEIMIGLDVLDAARGDTRWPGKAGEPLPMGLEFVLHAYGDTVRILADSASNPWRTFPIRDTMQSGPAPRSEYALPGFTSGRFEVRLNPGAGSSANSDGAYTNLMVAPNRRRLTRDGIEIPALAYDRGVLREGAAPDGLWQRLPDGTLEVRIPWTLINVTDPSQRRVLDDRAARRTAILGTTLTPGIRIAARVRDADGATRVWPTSGRLADVAQFTWPTWETPAWSVRQRPVFDAMRTVFARLQPIVMQ